MSPWVVVMGSADCAWQSMNAIILKPMDIRDELYSLTTMTLLTERIQRIVNERGLSFAHQANTLLEQGKITEYYARRLIISSGAQGS